MRILSIASILPVPGIKKGNDFVFQTYLNYKKSYPGDEIIIIKPLKIDLNPLVLLKNIITCKLPKIYDTKFINGFRVEIMPFLSWWTFRDMHSLLSRTLYYFNRKRILKVLSTGKFDIIHAQFVYSDGMLANMLCRKYGIPYVITTHNERFYFDHPISARTGRRILNQASGVYPINHSNYTFFKKLQIPNLELIPLGFNSSFIKPQKPQKTGPVKVLTVCELIPLKNVDKVIDAIHVISGRHEVHLTVIGRGPEKKSLEQKAISLKMEPVVSFIEYIPYEEIGEEMYKHDIFIMPSYFETFGRVYFEAMAMGIPVICAKNSGIYGIFKEYEEGISVNHNSNDDIVNALEFLITKPEERYRIGANGKNLVEGFTWSAIAEILHSRYTAISR
ncbi:MAG TPA: glycosyltransferase [Bacteroidales bacterium]|nr:glycosyltransferase [Bacteroidales bacterium]